jgi:hypothetical protein
LPALLAEYQRGHDLLELGGDPQTQLKRLFLSWYAKAPEAALAWLHGLPNASDRCDLLGPVVAKLAKTDFDAALALVQQLDPDERPIPSDLLNQAAAQGADQLLDVCRLGLGRGNRFGGSGLLDYGGFRPSLGRESGCCGVGLSYPQGFDFQRVLDGLAETKAGAGEGQDFACLPCNLVGEWAARDPQAAWAWLQQRKNVPFNDRGSFWEGYAKDRPAEEVGTFLGSVFDPAVPDWTRYDGIFRVLWKRPDGELLDSFLQAAPEVAGGHFDGLVEASLHFGGGNTDQVRALILARMDPAQRLAVLERQFDDGHASAQERKAFAPLLQQLGHSEEEIRPLLMEQKK